MNNNKHVLTNVTRPSTRRGQRSSQLPAATVPPEAMPPWEAMASQFPATGFPGITATVEHPADFPEITVDALQYRALDGTLIGLLIRYPLVTGFEEDGNFNMWVRPDRQREGIATSLVKDALGRWSNIDLTKQSYTPAGRAVAARMADQPQSVDRSAGDQKDQPLTADPRVMRRSNGSAPSAA